MAEKLTTDMAVLVVENGNIHSAEVQLNGDALYLNYHQLNTLPLELFDAGVCTALRRLYLKHNLLTTLPPEIKMFGHLTELYLNCNGLRTLPAELGELTQLELLGISDNQLTSLPQCIFHLQNLKRLQLSKNKLTHLPAEIGKLQLLETLEVSHNCLCRLPRQLSCCSSLRHLCVDSNQLVIMPRQLCLLKQLSEISACDNQLISLPQGLGSMPALQALYVDNNPYLTAVPASTLHKTIGFCGSGKLAVPEKLMNMQHCIKINSVNEEEVVIPMPPEIRSLGHICTNNVPMLLELTLRVVFKALQNSGSELQEEVPAELLSFLQIPTAHCQHCGLEIFISAFPIIFRAQVKAYNLLLLGLCCSSACVRQCSLIVHLPLLYPPLEDLALAVVLA